MIIFLPKIQTLVLLFLSAFLLITTIFGYPGDLDPTFNGSGSVSTQFGFGTDFARAMAIQTDGKIVVAGYANFNNNRDFAVVRYNADGSLDNSFGTAGKVTTPISKGDEEANSIAIQTDGKIVVIGRTKADVGDDFAVVRYNPDGSLDSSFGADGVVTTDFGESYCMANSVAIQSDGKIVVAGAGGNGFALARYQTDGSPDKSFDEDGKLSTAVGNYSSAASSLAIQKDGKIVVGGSGAPDQSTDFAIVRYNEDGSLDERFGDGGITLTPIGTYTETIASVAIQNDGKIIAAGQVYIGTISDFAVVRYDTDGTVDRSFGNSGKVTVSVGVFSDFAYSAAIQPDGKIVLAGQTDDGNNYQIALMRCNPDGTLDQTFGNNGKLVTLTPSQSGVAYAVALGFDGKIFVAGYSAMRQNSDIAVLKYHADGRLDTSFGTNGRTVTDIGNAGGEWKSLLIQPDGKYLAVGFAWGESDRDFALARYNPDGTPDRTFNGNGKILMPLGTNDNEISSAALQADGKILVTGYSSLGYMIARFNANGSLDNSFGNNGIVFFSFGLSTVTVQPDGKIVGAGSVRGSADSDVAVVRCNTDGSPDNTFGIGGKVFTPVGNYNDGASSVAVQTDGKIVAAGTSMVYTGRFYSDFAVVRYNPDGSLDNTFGNNGKVIASVQEKSDEVRSMLIQPDGKILVSGLTREIENNSLASFAVIRLTPNGMLDRKFNRNGKVITPIGSDSNSFSIALQMDGKIILGGSSGAYHFDANSTLLRIYANGSLDDTFGVSPTNYLYGPNGSAVINLGGHDAITRIVLQADQKIVAAISGERNVMRIARFAGDSNTALEAQDGQFSTGFTEKLLEPWKNAEARTK